MESGFARENPVNILSKLYCLRRIFLGFYLLGWGLMFGDGNGFIGLQGLLAASGLDNSPATGEGYQGVYTAISWAGIPFWAKFFFQLVFCGTAATIVSGAVAERIKYISFIVFSFILTLVVYPLVGHWIWGGGWLQSWAFWTSREARSSTLSALGGACRYYYPRTRSANTGRQDPPHPRP